MLFSIATFITDHNYNIRNPATIAHYLSQSGVEFATDRYGPFAVLWYDRGLIVQRQTDYFLHNRIALLEGNTE